MGRIAASLAFALCAAPFATALAAPLPEPTCRLPSVIEVLAQQLRLNPRYTRIDPLSIAEVPTADPRLVSCAVCVEVLHYDMPRLGELPATRCEPRRYAVQAVRNGYVVRLVP